MDTSKDGEVSEFGSIQHALSRLSIRTTSVKGGIDRKRRLEERLKLQKTARFDYQQLARQLAQDNDFLENPVQVETQRKGVKRKAEELTPDSFTSEPAPKIQNQYADQLMIPEELYEVTDFPDDLTEKWLCAPCPTGRRCLVVSSNNNTTCRLRNGHLHSKFPSFLPGGGQNSKRTEYCILDCILDELSLTFHILDLMVWKANLYYNCEAEFRSYWLDSKISEESDLLIVCKQNPYKFVPVPHYPCDPATLSTIITQNKNSDYYFYHRGGHYEAGEGEAPFMLHASAKLFKEYFNCN